tara:strand:- start:5018 stop:5740 length:723 start_codon:yes stop_codon:yes gene_type:complete
MISWSFIKNQVSLIHWKYPEFLSSKVDTLPDAGKLAQELTEANHEYLKDMFAYEITTPVLELAIIKTLTKSDAKFAIIQIPGSVIASEFTIRTMNHMEKHSDCSLLGQVVNKKDSQGDRWWGVMPYTMVINLQHFKQAGKPFFGNRRDAPEPNQKFPVIEKTEQGIKSTGEKIESTNDRLFYGWNWIHSFVSNGKSVHTFDERLNPFRQFVYYESDKDLEKHNWLIDNMVDYVEDGLLDD